MSIFDAMVNNADRKIGHLLPAGRTPRRLRSRRRAGRPRGLQLYALGRRVAFLLS